MQNEDGINLTFARIIVDSSVQIIRGRRVVVSVGGPLYARLLLGGSALFRSVTDVAGSCVIGVIVKRDACASVRELKVLIAAR